MMRAKDLSDHDRDHEKTFQEEFFGDTGAKNINNWYDSYSVKDAYRSGYKSGSSIYNHTNPIRQLVNIGAIGEQKRDVLLKTQDTLNKKYDDAVSDLNKYKKKPISFVESFLEKNGQKIVDRLNN